VISNPRKVLHTPAPYKDDRVFLEVVAFATDVRRDLKTVG
jgi:hypothetical protein